MPPNTVEDTIDDNDPVARTSSRNGYTRVATQENVAPAESVAAAPAAAASCCSAASSLSATTFHDVEINVGTNGELSDADAMHGKVTVTDAPATHVGRSPTSGLTTSGGARSDYVPTFLRNRSTLSGRLATMRTSPVCRYLDHRIVLVNFHVPTLLLIAVLVLLGVFVGPETAVIGVLIIGVLALLSYRSDRATTSSGGATASGQDARSRIRTVRDLPPIARSSGS
jgi:hypothetical protein